MVKYRNLTDLEISDLENNACKSDNWNDVMTIDGFSSKHINNVCFSGKVCLGIFEKQFTLNGNINKHSGLFNCTIHNCVVGNNVYINKVHEHLANYEIEEGVYIENVGAIVTDNRSYFGNSTNVSVMCEAGGRDVPIYDKMSAQLAYMLAMYRDRVNAIDILTKLISEYSDIIKSDKGRICKNSCITGCKVIKNVNIGENAVLDNVFKLVNGTINSSISSPTYIGIGVIAENFIISDGSNISDGALINNCFIGQHCTLGKQYSAENSLFFSNCVGYHGEACSIFAGPFTVSHHKSSLLIAGQFSFMNAGSGSNQSNHLYKLGPVHQGIFERGSKTASDSYIMWPAKIGPFTVVMGRHTKNSDTSDLPFSYLIENNDESILVPGVNIKSVGTIRDAQKWPMRDKRDIKNTLDCINFNLLSPFTIHRMYKALEILTNLQHTSGEDSQSYTYKSTIIKHSSLNKGIKYYNMAIMKFLGNSLISRIEMADIKTEEELRNALKPQTTIGSGVWIDMAGLITPKSEILKLLLDIELEKLSLQDIQNRFLSIHQNYYIYEWTWALDKIENMVGKKYDNFTFNDIIDFVEKWKDAVISIDKLLYEDAKKEFGSLSKTGFGVDGEGEACKLDFESVRGSFESNKFVEEVLSHIDRKTVLGDKMINKFRSLAFAQNE